MPEGDSKYDEFIGGLRLISIGLKSCSASVDSHGLFKLLDERTGPMRIFRDSYKVMHVGRNFFEASGTFMVRVQESPESRPVVLVECEFEAHLHGPEPISKASVERFVDSEFRLLVVPYARQFVSAMSAQMSIPPLIIPLSVGSSKESTIRTKKPKKVNAKAR